MMDVTLYNRGLTCPKCDNRNIKLSNIIENGNEIAKCEYCKYAFKIDLDNIQIGKDGGTFFTGTELGWACDNDNCNNIVKKKKDLYEQEYNDYECKTPRFCIDCQIETLENELSAITKQFEPLKAEIAKLKKKKEKQ